VITTWRIVKARYAATAFDGKGARLVGGRWNSPGLRMIYTSQSAALAVLELLVHLGRRRSLIDYVIFSCTFEDSLVEMLPAAALPRGWRSYPAPSRLQQIGDEWTQSGRSAVLEVPSAVIEDEHNFLLNPEHADFSQISISAPRRLELDFRLTEP